MLLVGTQLVNSNGGLRNICHAVLITSIVKKKLSKPGIKNKTSTSPSPQAVSGQETNVDHRLSGADRAKHTKFDERTMMLEAILETDEGEEVYYFPTKYEVCSTCDGKGSHVNPSIDSHGITSDEWQNDWSHEEQEEYMLGGYDVSCYECSGKRVVPVVDEDKCSDELKSKVAAWHKQLADLAVYDAQSRREQEMGY